MKNATTKHITYTNDNRKHNLILDANTQSTFKSDANARTPKRARAGCHFNALQAAAVRWVGRNGVRHRVSAKKAKKNPVRIVWNHDDYGILACDGGQFKDKEVFIVYEDRNEHLHSEVCMLLCMHLFTNKNTECTCVL